MVFVAHCVGSNNWSRVLAVESSPRKSAVATWPDQTDGAYAVPIEHTAWKKYKDLLRATRPSYAIRLWWSVWPEESAVPAPGSVAVGLARRFADSCSLKTPHDVRLFFPNLGDDGLELWARSSLLKNASPYLKALLESDFTEGAVKRSKRRRTTPAAAGSTSGDATMEQDGTALDDSDDEADEVVLESGPPTLDSSDTGELEYREIKVTETAYSTYRALLTYLNTSLALKNLKSQLSVENIADELFGDVSHLYEDIRHVELEYAVAHWHKVKTSQGMEDIRRRVRGGGVPHFAEVMAELVPRI